MKIQLVAEKAKAWWASPYIRAVIIIGAVAVIFMFILGTGGAKYYKSLLYQEYSQDRNALAEKYEKEVTKWKNASRVHEEKYTKLKADREKIKIVIKEVKGRRPERPKTREELIDRYAKQGYMVLQTPCE